MDSHSKYGRIYTEICRGFSTSIIEKSTVYFKHPTLADYFSTYSNYDIFINNGRKKGLQLEKEKIEDAIKGGWWSPDKESKFNLLKKTIQNLFKTRDKLLYPSQKLEIEKQIKQQEAILITYAKERQEIVGYTLENYASNKLTEELLVFFSYKNSEFTEKLFSSREEYYNLTDSYMETIKNNFSSYSEALSDSVKKIAACGFFQNLLYVNEDASGFWGKPATQCTKYQIDTLVYGKMYKNIIKNYATNDKPVPDEILSDPDKFVEWVNNQSNGPTAKLKNKKTKTGGSNMVTSTVGATKEDLNKLGVKVEKLRGGKSLLDMASESGGVLEKSDYFKARENN